MPSTPAAGAAGLLRGRLEGAAGGRLEGGCAEPGVAGPRAPWGPNLAPALSASFAFVANNSPLCRSPGWLTAFFPSMTSLLQAYNSA